MSKLLCSECFENETTIVGVSGNVTSFPELYGLSVNSYFISSARPPEGFGSDKSSSALSSLEQECRIAFLLLVIGSLSSELAKGSNNEAEADSPVSPSISFFTFDASCFLLELVDC